MQILKEGKYLFPKFVLLTVLMFVFAAAPAGAATRFSFEGLTTTDNAGIGEAQLFVDVSDYEGNTDMVQFLFHNIGDLPCTIAHVFIADGEYFDLETPATIVASAGVSFSGNYDEGPPSVPGAPDWFKDAQFFSAPANPSPAINGVDPTGLTDPDEWLKIILDLADGVDTDQVIAAMDPSIRGVNIGLHVISFADEGSESFVHTPIPASVLLLGSGLIGLVGFRRKKIAK